MRGFQDPPSTRDIPWEIRSPKTSPLAHRAYLSFYFLKLPTPNYYGVYYPPIPAKPRAWTTQAEDEVTSLVEAKATNLPSSSYLCCTNSDCKRGIRHPKSRLSPLALAVITIMERESACPSPTPADRILAMNDIYLKDVPGALPTRIDQRPMAVPAAARRAV